MISLLDIQADEAAQEIDRNARLSSLSRTGGPAAAQGNAPSSWGLRPAPHVHSMSAILQQEEEEREQQAAIAAVELCIKEEREVEAVTNSPKGKEQGKERRQRQRKGAHSRPHIKSPAGATGAAPLPAQKLDAASEPLSAPQGDEGAGRARGESTGRVKTSVNVNANGGSSSRRRRRQGC